MVKIRLARSGAKKRPFYHLVVTDQRNSRDGRYIERLGFYNPVAVGGEVPLRINVERVEHWQGKGAQTSERVLHLVKHFAKHGEESAPARAAPAESKAKPKPAAPEKPAEPEAAQAKADDKGAEEVAKEEEKPEANAGAKAGAEAADSKEADKKD